MRAPILLVSVSLCFCGSIPPQASAEISAGAAKVSITPDPKTLPYQLGGYVAKERTGVNATGIHDACYSRALVLGDGARKAAIVSLDLCFIPASLKTAVLQKIGGASIPAEGLFLAATHTHSGPDPLALHAANTGPAGSLPTYDEKLTEYIVERIAQSILEANSRLKPASVGSGQMQKLGLNRNRRGENATDDEMTALEVADGEGKTIAAVFVYAAHPVYYGPDMLHVSGDWSGTFQRQMEASLPGAVALFLNGAEGDASPNGADEGRPAEKIDVYSAKLNAKARELLDQIKPDGAVNLSAWSETAELGKRVPHPLFLLASATLKATQQQARELVDRLMPERVEISFVRVGDLLLMGVPGEPTTPIGLEAKEDAREKQVKHPAIVALTNGWIGYIVSPEQYKAGRYEPTMSFYGDQVGVKVLAGIRSGLSKLK